MLHLFHTVTTRPVFDLNDDCYKIVIGGEGNSRIVIRRKQQAASLRNVLFNGLNAFKTILYIIQITSRRCESVHLNERFLSVSIPFTDGDIRIFRQDSSGSFQLAAEATDSNPIPVQYISFRSWATVSVQFYFNCSFNFVMPESVSTATHHPLLAKEELIPPVDWRNCKLRN